MTSASRRRAACCFLALVLGLASACVSKAREQIQGPAPDIETYLSCGGGLRELMVVDHDGTGDPRSPEEMAGVYAAAVGRSFSGQRKVVYRSAQRVHIIFTDGEGRVRGVLSYGRYGSGWQLDTGVNCA